MDVRRICQLENEEEIATICGNRGLVLFQEEKFAEAIQWLLPSVARRPWLLDMVYVLGVAFMENRQCTEAVARFNHIIELDPKHVESHLRKAEIFARQKNFVEAEAAYNKVLDINPGQKDALLGKAELYIERQEYRKATMYCNKILNRDKKDPAALIGKGLACAEKWEPTAAIELFNMALQTNPTEPRALYHKGLVLADQGRYDEALELYEKVLAQDSRAVHALNAKGSVLYAKNNYKGAMDWCEKALSIEPDNVHSIHNRGEILMQLGDTAAALAHFEKALRLDPHFAWSLMLKGELLLSLGATVDAADCFNKAISRNPRELLARLRYDQALTFQAEGQMTIAAQWFQRAATTNTLLLHTSFAYIGGALMKLKQLDDALRYLDQALAIDHNYIPALCFKAETLLGQQKFDEAAHLITRVLIINPCCCDAQLLQGRLMLCKHQDAAHSILGSVFLKKPGYALLPLAAP